MFSKMDLAREDISQYDVGKKLKLALHSISQGNTLGELWSYNQETFFLWDKGNVVLYIFGKKLSIGSLEDLRVFFEDVIRKDAVHEGFQYFKLDDATGSIPVSSIFGDLESLDSYFYGYNKEDVTVPVGCFDIVDIDEDLLKKTGLSHLEQVEDEIRWMWPSLDRFFEKGFGKAAIIDDKIVCWCTAEYVSENMCGIGIETSEEHRKQGIATVTAAEFIRYALDKGIRPHWECHAKNQASVRLADKLGFSKLESKTVYLGRF